MSGLSGGNWHNHTPGTVPATPQQQANRDAWVAHHKPSAAAPINTPNFGQSPVHRSGGSSSFNPVRALVVGALALVGVIALMIANIPSSEWRRLTTCQPDSGMTSPNGVDIIYEGSNGCYRPDAAKKALADYYAKQRHGLSQADLDTQYAQQRKAAGAQPH
jgi:hypothetical protein